MIFDIEKITYGDSEMDSRTHYQAILHGNDEIGVLIERETSILKPIEQTFQFGEVENFIPEDMNFFESEDEGWVYVTSDSLEDFIEKKNIIEKIKNGASNE